MTALILLALAMFIADLCADIGVVLIARGHGLSAGIVDVIGDMSRVVMYGGGGVAVVQAWKHHEPWHAAAIMAALAVGSILGSVVGTAIGARLSSELEQP